VSTPSTPRLVHVFPAFSTGGPEVRTAILINAMTEFAHTIVSLNGDVSGRSRLDEPDSMTFVTGPFPSGAGRLWALGRLLGRQQPDLLITYGWGGTDAILGARLARLKRPVHIEDGFLPDEAHGQKFARLQARRCALPLATDLVVPSKTLQRIATSTWWLPSRKVHFFPNGVDTNRFRPGDAHQVQAARDRIGALPGELVIGTVGMLRPDKNHARMIRVFAGVARQHPARLLIVGEGECRAQLVELSRQLHIQDRVIFTGAVVDPSSYYGALDIFALSSDTEQMPLSVLEAMAAGLPVASTDVGDVSEMVGAAGRAFISPRTDEEGLGSSLARLGHDVVVRQSLGLENRARVLAQFSLTAMTESYRNLFRQRLAAPGVRH